MQCTYNRPTVLRGSLDHNKNLPYTEATVNITSPLSVVEGNTGTTNFNIEVELQIGSLPLARDVVVTLSTEDGTAAGKLAVE